MNLKKFDLNGKTALITGGAGLLGIEHAAALLELGAIVVITDILDSALSEAKTRLSYDYPVDHIVTCVMDVTNQDGILKVKEWLGNKNIFIDILINNAAIDPKVTAVGGELENSRLENFSLEDWNLQVSVGLTGAFLCSKIFGQSMVKMGNGGVILNIASDLSIFSPDQRIYRNSNLTEDKQPVKPVTYSVIKTGLIGLTRYLATYWVEQGVRANSLSPGGVFNGQNEEFVHRLSSLIPLGRMARGDEYRSAVQFLCSDASSYMNGQNIVIDGGRSVW